jgi:hypothetical protein
MRLTSGLGRPRSRGWAVVVLTTVAAAAVTMISASSAGAAPVARTAAAACNGTTSKIDGGPAVSYCGPATATLRIGSKTYAFKNGSCTSIHVSGITVDITLGTIAEGKTGTGVKGNAGKPYFSLDLSPGKNSDLLHAVDSGGKTLTSAGIVLASGTIKSTGASKGTFKSPPNSYDLAGKPFSFSGSWNCHGAFTKH